MFKELTILAPIFNDPLRKFGVREFAKILHLAPATASTKLEQLRKEGILTIQKERNVHLYRANIENLIYRDLKIYYNITKLRQSGLLEYLSKIYLLPTIIVFGSTSTGYDTKESDIDLVIVTEVTPKSDSLSLFEKKLGRSLQLFIVRDIKELKNPHLINNVLGGIVLQGQIKWT